MIYQITNAATSEYEYATTIEEAIAKLSTNQIAALATPPFRFMIIREDAGIKYVADLDNDPEVGVYTAVDTLQDVYTHTDSLSAAKSTLGQMKIQYLASINLAKWTELAEMPV